MAWASKSSTDRVVKSAYSAKEHARLRDLLKSTSSRSAGFSLRGGNELLELIQRGGAREAAVLTQQEGVEADGELVMVEGFSQPPARASASAGQPTFEVAGGVNLPKILKCWGTDGRVYKQLVKGCDDLRGDAVTQQAREFCSPPRPYSCGGMPSINHPVVAFHNVALF